MPAAATGLRVKRSLSPPVTSSASASPGLAAPEVGDPSGAPPACRASHARCLKRDVAVAAPLRAGTNVTLPLGLDVGFAITCHLIALAGTLRLGRMVERRPLFTSTQPLPKKPAERQDYAPRRRLSAALTTLLYADNRAAQSVVGKLMAAFPPHGDVAPIEVGLGQKRHTVLKRPKRAAAYENV